MWWLLRYEVVEDYIERRAPLRADHLALVREAHDRGVLVMAGALDDPPDGAVLVFRTDDPSEVERFAEADPYVRAGVVTAWEARRWNVVVGPGVEPPVLT